MPTLRQLPDRVTRWSGSARRCGLAFAAASGRANPDDAQRSTVIGIGQLGCEQTCSTAKENEMASPTTLRTPYDVRVDIVKDAIVAHSKMKDQDASELAVHVLQALNSIPEKVR